MSNGGPPPPAPGLRWALIPDHPTQPGGGSPRRLGRAPWWHTDTAPNEPTPAGPGRLTLQDLFRVLREQWLVVLLAVLLGVIGSCAFWLLRPAEYTADVTFYVSAEPDAQPSTDAAYQGSLLSQQRVLSYVQLVNSTQVARAVATELNLPDSPDELADHISASSATDSVIINASVVESSPERAVAIANGLGAVFPRVVDGLERPATPGATSPVAVRAVLPVEVPEAPSTPGLPLTLVLGLLVGVTLGVAVAVVRDSLDRSVTSGDALSKAAGAPNLGVLGNDPDVRKGALALDGQRRHSVAESFRQLRTNLQFLDLDSPRRLLVITSTLPGEGKTTTVANLAAALAAAQARVLVVDCDLRRPNLAASLDLESVGVTDILAGKLPITRAVQRCVVGGFDVLASGVLPPNPSEVLASRQMASLLGRLRSMYDIVLIDSPPLLPVTDAAVLATRTDGAILLGRYRKVTNDQVRTAVHMLDLIAAPLLGTILTMAPRTATGGYESYHPSGPGPVAGSPQPAPVPPRAFMVPTQAGRPVEGDPSRNNSGTARPTGPQRPPTAGPPSPATGLHTPGPPTASAPEVTSGPPDGGALNAEVVADCTGGGDTGTGPSSIGPLNDEVGPEQDGLVASDPKSNGRVG